MSLRQYFTFSKRERIGILTLVLIMLFLSALPLFWKKPPPRLEVSLPEKQTVPSGRWPEREEFRSRYDHHYPYNGDSTRAFSTRYRYRNDKKGTFHGYYKSYADRNFNREPARYSIRTYLPYKSTPKTPSAPVNINTGDSTAFISLPGIGSRLAARIISFREKLGGFYTVDQVGEVYGIQDSVFQRIKGFLRCDPALVHKLSINEAGEEVLRQHPYIRWNLARSLVAYRSAHGPFSAASDLSKVNSLDSASLTKLLPYLSF